MDRERLDGTLSVKVPAHWLDLIDGLGDPEERDRGRVVRKLLRKALEDEGVLPSTDTVAEVPEAYDRPKARVRRK